MRASRASTRATSPGKRGDLLLEPVCEHDVIQADTISACTGYRNPLVATGRQPRLGTGPLVLYLDHDWDQIHPLEAIVVS